MWALMSLAFAFEPDTMISAPTGAYAGVSEQLVLSKTTLSFTRLDAGVPVVSFGKGFSVGASTRLTVAHASAPDQPSHTDLRSIHGALWFGWRPTDNAHFAWGASAGAPTQWAPRTYGLLIRESATWMGLSYRMRVRAGQVEVDFAANTYFSNATIFGGDFGLTATYGLSRDRIGLQVGAVGGLSDLAWITPGVRIRPAPAVEIGLTPMIAVPLFGDAPVHVSPMLSVRFRDARNTALINAKPGMEPLQ